MFLNKKSVSTDTTQLQISSYLLKSGRTGVCPNQKYTTSLAGSILEWAAKSVKNCGSGSQATIRVTVERHPIIMVQ
jgi:hypothetical protein